MGRAMGELSSANIGLLFQKSPWRLWVKNIPYGKCYLLHYLNFQAVQVLAGLYFWRDVHIRSYKPDISYFKNSVMIRHGAAGAVVPVSTEPKLVRRGMAEFCRVSSR